MAGSTRIERLRLRADSETAVRRTLPLLEDAFRTATLVHAGARLIFVRRLDLGRVPHRASAQALSLLLEKRFAKADWSAVHADDPAASRARAVWFRDPLEAHVLAAYRVAAGQRADAWFWPLAVPALAVASSPPETLRAIAFSLAAFDEAPAALPVWTAALVREGHEARLVAALHRGDGEALQRAAGASTAPARAAVRADVATPPAYDPHRDRGDDARPVRRMEDSPGVTAGDDRVEFIRSMLARTRLRTTRPLALLPSEVSGPAVDRARVGQQPARRLRGAAPVRSPERSAAPSPTGRPMPSAVHVHRSRLDAEAVPDPGTADTATPGALSVNTAYRRDDRRRNGSASAARAADDWWSAGGMPTAAGGLLFLVPVLERLGFREWSDRTDSRGRLPDTTPRQMFRLILSRLHVEGDDPAWSLAAVAEETDGEDADDALLSRLQSRLERIAPAFSPRHDVEIDRRIGGNATSPDLWLAGCRRLLRRRVGSGLATLVRRPARIALTDTHVDLFFALRAADVRIRRAGLDVDPGWVPWLAKVVTFHYQDRSWS